MSDFDKEAERERLREKYEEDGERESTRRMSELLLKGATMTDRHCEECGDPIFRYDGQAFCPTCQGAGGGAADANRDAEAAEAPPSDPDAGAADGEASVEVGTPPEGDRTAGTSDPADAARRPAAPERNPPAAEAHEAPDDAAGRERMTARASLERTLARFAREAEAAEDPRRARDLLAAAREAAEAIAALDRR